MKDLKIDSEGSLVIVNGDLAIGESDLQHQSDIMWAEKGWWHFRPDLGVALQQWINESGTAPTLVRVIRQELERDGAAVNSVAVNGDGITIDASYGE